MLMMDFHFHLLSHTLAQSNVTTERLVWRWSCSHTTAAPPWNRNTCETSPCGDTSRPVVIPNPHPLDLGFEQSQMCVCCPTWGTGTQRDTQTWRGRWTACRSESRCFSTRWCGSGTASPDVWAPCGTLWCLSACRERNKQAWLLYMCSGVTELWL